MKKFKSGRGGRRPGAGRPREYDDRVPVTVLISKAAKEILDLQPESQSFIIEELILSLRK